VGYIQSRAKETKLDIVGYFQADRQEYQLGQPISVTLYIKNQGHEVAYLWVAKGRDRGIRIEVEQGHSFEMKGMLQEPESGLLPEIRIAPGETVRQEFLLSKWLTLREPGSYVVECSIPIEVANRSLRDSGGKRTSKHVTVRSKLRLTVTAKGSKNE
jgi:hypothetical protein